MVVLVIMRVITTTDVIVTGNNCNFKRVVRSTLESDILANLTENGRTSHDEYIAWCYITIQVKDILIIIGLSTILIQ